MLIQNLWENGFFRSTNVLIICLDTTGNFYSVFRPNDSIVLQLVHIIHEIQWVIFW